MKRKEIQLCCLCKKGVMHKGVPMFTVLKVQRFIVNHVEIGRRAGLEAVFGGGGNGAILAEVMGDHADIALPIDDEEKVLFVCTTCEQGWKLHLMELHETKPQPTAVS